MSVVVVAVVVAVAHHTCDGDDLLWTQQRVVAPQVIGQVHTLLYLQEAIEEASATRRG